MAHGRFLQAAACVLLLAGGVARAQSPTPFALASPEIAAQLYPLAASDDAKVLLAEARAALKKYPNAMPRIHVEGTLPHQGTYDASLKALGDLDVMVALGFATRLANDPAFPAVEERFFEVWLQTYQLSFNPIDETHFDEFLLAYDLAGPRLSGVTRVKMNLFLHEMADGYLDGIAKNARHPNNWQSHRVKLAVLAAFALDDPALIDRAHQAFLDQLAGNIQLNGEVLDFSERDALHYVAYDLEPLCTAALAAKAHGQDWFHAPSATGSSLPAALDWLTPFARGEKTHEEFVHSPVKFDAMRAAAGVPGFSGQWDPAHSTYVYQLAAALDPKYQPIFALVSSGKKDHPSRWLKLLVQAGL